MLAVQEYPYNLRPIESKEIRRMWRALRTVHDSRTDTFPTVLSRYRLWRYSPKTKRMHSRVDT